MRRWGGWVLLSLLAVGCVDDRPPIGVGPRGGAGLSGAWDELRGVWVVLDAEPFEAAAATWIRDERGWQVAAVTGPSPRVDAALAWDPNRAQIVLFGGAQGSEFLRDTWAWDGVDWTELPVSGPPGRRQHALVWVPPRRALMLLGGQGPCPETGCEAQWWLGPEGWRSDP